MLVVVLGLFPDYRLRPVRTLLPKGASLFPKFLVFRILAFLKVVSKYLLGRDLVASLTCISHRIGWATFQECAHSICRRFGRLVSAAGGPFAETGLKNTPGVTPQTPLPLIPYLVQIIVCVIGAVTALFRAYDHISNRSLKECFYERHTWRGGSGQGEVPPLLSDGFAKTCDPRENWGPEPF